MGALPSHETHERGLYSHRHGRNRRNEIILIPLTTSFFPSPDCPLFQHLYNSRYRRTAKYYFRALRSAQTPRDSDYFCTTTAINEEEEFEKFYKEYLEKRELCGEKASVAAATATAVSPTASSPLLSGCSATGDSGADAGSTNGLSGAIPSAQSPQDCLNAQGLPPRVGPMDFRSYSDTREGLAAMDDLSFDEFVSGYVAAKRYMKGKPLHTSFSTTAAADVKGNPITPAMGAAGSAKVLNEYSARHYKHVTSPVAYDVRPLPCVIASRYDPGKPQPVNDPLYVQFGDSYVRIMGMFGFFPSTIGMRRAAGSRGSEDGTGSGKPQRSFPRKEGNCNGSDDIDEEFEIEQHLLKGTMFVDKDVGDQILGNMVMLATYMYVRQCIEARIHPQAIPMLPVLIRFPLSNIPMLQFVREFRVRLRSLLEAGTAKAGQKPVHTGMSGFNPEDLAEPHHPQLQRLEEEGYLFEPDIPCATTPQQVFMSVEQASSTTAPLRRHVGMKTPSCGKYPIIMMSGFNVQSTPLRHPALNTTGYPPAMAAAAMIAAAHRHSAMSSPQSSSKSASPYAASGMGRAPTFPLTAPPPPLPGQVGSASAALLHRRKQRFRIWVEDGHICIWASAAYARRAALIMAQQLNTTVDSNSVPEQRSWNYRGLLHANTTVPPPRHVNDVIIVAEDIPTMDLWQGDVLRCCTQAELQAMLKSKGAGPLPLPCAREETESKSGAITGTTERQAASLSIAAAAKPAAMESIGGFTSPSVSSSTADSGVAAAGAGGHVNFTSNHAFWVRGSGGLDDSFTNITETNMPPHPKAEKQLMQAAMQRAKKAAAAVAVAQNSGKKRRPTNAEAAVSAAAQLFIDIDRREGTMNIEEVVLAWIKVVAILTRDSTEEDRAWVRDPQGNPVRVDRYVIRRYEHDGVRFFIGVTPRFVGQQRRIEKVLGEVFALEEREGHRWRLKNQGRGEEDEECEDGLHTSHDDDPSNEEEGHHRHSSVSHVSRHTESLSYAFGASAASSVKAPDSCAGGMSSMFDDVWGTLVIPMTHSPPSSTACTPVAPLTVGPKMQSSLAASLNAALPRSDSGESVENSSRLAFTAVFGNAAPAAGKSAATTSLRTRDAELMGAGFEVDDLLERYASAPLFFGGEDDE
ncbi:hypothetical protein CGC20_3435 [Leishmania donovani]|uniref:Uncharacterized protein n=1 Tax=Leishmania donovani TaxID=5661 RepID=A0A504X8X9_LEIDO|nr:hypothetical protein CGC20_3435 [Leishmania donovani]